MSDFPNLGAKVLGADPGNSAAKAASEIHAIGGSPRLQLEAAREAARQPKIKYLPHIGAKQREKARRAAAKKGV